MTTIPIVLIEGDGIGPEIVPVAASVVEATGTNVEWVSAVAGMTALRTTGDVVPEATIAVIKETGAALKGPFYTPSGGSQRSANYYIRHGLDLYACLRPLRYPALDHEVRLVRENVEDLYGAVEWMAAPGVAHAVKVATEAGCSRIARFAFEQAERTVRHVTIVHKANNLKLTEGMFLEVARSVGADFPDVRIDDLLADTAAAMMVSAPQTLDVVLTSNTYGDILSNVGGAAARGLGTVPTLNVGPDSAVAEASHGSADAIQGRGEANPLGLIDAAGMLLEHLGCTAQGKAVLAATSQIRRSGPLTPDMGGTASTTDVGEAVCGLVAELMRVTA